MIKNTSTLCQAIRFLVSSIVGWWINVLFFTIISVQLMVKIQPTTLEGITAIQGDVKLTLSKAVRAVSWGELKTSFWEGKQFLHWCGSSTCNEDRKMDRLRSDLSYFTTLGFCDRSLLFRWSAHWMVVLFTIHWKLVQRVSFEPQRFQFSSPPPKQKHRPCSHN